MPGLNGNAFINVLIIVNIICNVEVNGIPQRNTNRNDRIVYPGETAPYIAENPLIYNHNHSHYHHQHHQSHADYDDYDYDARPGTEHQTKYRNQTNGAGKIPVEFVAKLNGVSHVVNDLLLRYVDGYEDDDFIQDRFGEERSSAVIPTPAACTPEKHTVPLGQSDDSSVLFIPSCTKIDRCGGCCNHVLLECRPTEVESKNYKVIKAQYTGGDKMKLVEKMVVTLEKHLKCECGCKVRPEVKDCAPTQEYRPEQCKCACRNSDDHQKCMNDRSREWYPETCECKCRRKMKFCTTGSVYDDEQCKCVIPTVRRRFAEN